MFASVMNVLMVTYHAPQTKNSKNIITDKSVMMSGTLRGEDGVW